LRRLLFEELNRDQARGEAMPIYWSYKRLPELSALPDAERKDVWRKPVQRAYERWESWLVLPIAFIVMYPIGSWLGSTIGNDFVGFMIPLVVAGAIGV
jgi:hypothetical protein